jgi:hypothetical protein
MVSSIAQFFAAESSATPSKAGANRAARRLPLGLGESVLRPASIGYAQLLLQRRQAFFQIRGLPQLDADLQNGTGGS